jgi:dipeptidyl aminopeptidase/acylaminoacyl peptidase
MRVGTLGVFLALLAFVVVDAGPVEAQDGRRPMTVDDAMDMVQVSDPLMSPDGSWVLYSRRTLNWDENEYETEYWRAPADGGEAFRFIGEEGGSQFQFSPNGTFLTFRRAVGGGSGGSGGDAGDAEGGSGRQQQIFLMRTAGGEAVQLTKHATSVARYRWAHDSSAIFFQATDEKPEEVEKEEKKGADAIFVDEGPNGQTAGNWSNLWVFDIDAKQERQITDAEIIIGSWDVAPDGQRLALTARSQNRRNDAYLYEIHVADVETGELTQLTTNRAPEGGISWAPDGSSILYTAADDQEWMNRNTKLWLLDPTLEEHRFLSRAFEGTPRNPVWSPDAKTIYFSGQQGTNTNLFAIDIDSGSVRQLTEVEGTLVAPSFSADRTAYVYSLTDYRTPSDLWVGRLDGSEPVRLTDANPQLKEWQLAEMRVIDWQSRDDFTIEGLFHLPPGYVEGERVPLVLNIHGGPAGSFSNRWRPSYHIYAGLGYASLSPNVRGSSGYTDHLREGNTVAKGDGIGFGDYWDLMTGVDRLIEDGVVDPDRMAVKGWSYGGILGGWTITQTDRFKAASIGAGVYDWTSEYGPGFNNDVRLWHIGGTPWANPEEWRNQSALTHVANITTATLLIHGINDTTDTEQQSMMFFTAIKDIGKAPVRYMKFAREPHGFREPRHQRTRDVEELRWMQQHVLGEEWTPWERPVEAGEDGDADEKKAETTSNGS